MEKLDALKLDYPAVYIDYCQYFNKKEDLDKYVEECMRLRVEWRTKLIYYLHGGVLPTLKKDRESGNLRTGKYQLIIKGLSSQKYVNWK